MLCHIYTANVFISNLAGLWAVWVELDLFDSEFSARVSIVTEEDPTKTSLTQQLSQAPVCWGTRSYKHTHTHFVKRHVMSALMQQNLSQNKRGILTFLKPTATGRADVHDRECWVGARVGFDVATTATTTWLFQFRRKNAAATAGARALVCRTEAHG